MTDRIALITGGGSGIGRAVAQALAEAGWRVIVTGRTASALSETVGLLNGRGESWLCDISDPQAVATLFAHIEKTHGRLDLLFNNAGTSLPALAIEDVTPAQWQSISSVNLDGALYCMQAAFRLMKRQNPKGGRIINNGSISAHVPRPGGGAYAITKHAITGLTRAGALEGRAHAIAVGQIDIGNAGTAMTQGMAAGVLQADGTISAEPTFDVQHVGAAVVSMAALPLDANVPFLTIMATAMPYMGRG